MTSTETNSTRPSEQSSSKRWDIALRVISIGVVGMLVLAGLLGFLGVRSATAVASANGYTVEVIHAVVTRPGLATPLEVSVTRDDGSALPPMVTTRIESSYLAMFDENGLDPAPVSSFQSGRWTLWTFEVPDGAQILKVTLDARLEPAVQSGRDSTVSVVVDGEEMVMVGFRTWVMP